MKSELEEWKEIMERNSITNVSFNISSDLDTYRFKGEINGKMVEGEVYNMGMNQNEGEEQRSTLHIKLDNGKILHLEFAEQKLQNYSIDDNKNIDNGMLWKGKWVGKKVIQ